VAWLTMTTSGAEAGASPSRKSRPRSSGMFIAPKNPGVTTRKAIGIAVSGGSGDGPVVTIGVWV
jgi:hypothetical protein